VTGFVSSSVSTPSALRLVRENALYGHAPAKYEPEKICKRRDLFYRPRGW
jgi:hypothetical protein